MTKKRIDDWFSNTKDNINVREWLKTFNTESATECYTAVQRLKERVNEQE